MGRAATEYGVLTLVALTLACSSSVRTPTEDTPPRPPPPEAAAKPETAVVLKVPGAVEMRRISPAPTLALLFDGVLRRTDGVYSFELAKSRPENLVDPKYSIKDGEQPKATVVTLGSDVRRYKAVYWCIPGFYVLGGDDYEKLPGDDMGCTLSSSILLTPDVTAVQVHAFGRLVAEIPRGARPGPGNPAAFLAWGASDPTLFAHANPSDTRIEVAVHGPRWGHEYYEDWEPTLRPAWRRVPLCKTVDATIVYAHIGWGLDWVSFELDADEWIPDGLNAIELPIRHCYPEGYM